MGEPWVESVLKSFNPLFEKIKKSYRIQKRTESIKTVKKAATAVFAVAVVASFGYIMLQIRRRNTGL